jgi:hypothetical protein
VRRCQSIVKDKSLFDQQLEKFASLMVARNAISEPSLPVGVAQAQPTIPPPTSATPKTKRKLLDTTTTLMMQAMLSYDTVPEVSVGSKRSRDDIAEESVCRRLQPVLAGWLLTHSVFV